MQEKMGPVAPPPPSEIVMAAWAKIYGEREKLIDSISRKGTAAFRLLQNRISEASWHEISADEAFEEAYCPAIKDAFDLWNIILRIYAGKKTGTASSSMTPAERERAEQQWEAWTQGSVDLSQYFQEFKDRMVTRGLAGLPEITPANAVEKFYGKLDQVRYAELIRKRRNDHSGVVPQTEAHYDDSH